MDPSAYIEMQELEDSHWWFVARRQIITDLLYQFCSLPCKILEVGCGTGGNLTMLRQFGELKAFEMDPSALEMAHQKGVNDVTLTLGVCPDYIPYEGEQFDLICLFDVLEHIKEDQKTLVQLKKYLKPQGKIIITVPAYSWLFGPHDQLLQHHRRYSLAGLKKVIHHSGLKIQKISYFNTFLFPIAVINRLIEQFLYRFNFTKRQTAVTKPNFIINSVLRTIFAYERHVLRIRNLPVGLSLIGVLSA
jgi:SAM-dependent methyltransferase